MSEIGAKHKKAITKWFHLRVENIESIFVSFLERVDNQKNWVALNKSHLAVN